MSHTKHRIKLNKKASEYYTNLFKHETDSRATSSYETLTEALDYTRTFKKEKNNGSNVSTLFFITKLVKENTEVPK